MIMLTRINLRQEEKSARAIATQRKGLQTTREELLTIFLLTPPRETLSCTVKIPVEKWKFQLCGLKFLTWMT